MTDINEIKSRLNIEDVVAEYIKLEKSGIGFKAPCPFHNEKTPSFNVSPSRGIYKCFGCGESGDIFNFVEKIEGISFQESLEKLAQKAGVELTKSTGKSKKEREKEKTEKENLLKILEDSTKFFQINLLKDEKAKNYLKKRGVDEKTVKKFRIGLAKDSWHDLEIFLTKKGYSKVNIEKVGLIKKNEKGNVYDRFRDRIVFPIFDLNDNPIAFSGRDLSEKDNTAKYLNSPETIFFNKSEILYGLNLAKNEARRRKYFIIVEGQMDLIMSHKVGFKNTVATSGTSLTEQHLKNLSRFSKNLIFAFDSDNAGIEASYKGMKKALTEDFDVKILNIPENNDPADIILDDEKKWLTIVKDSRNIIDFFIKKIMQKESSLKEKIFEMEEKILPFIAEINNPIEKGQYISRVASGFNVEPETVLKVVDKIKINEVKKVKEKAIKTVVNKEVLKFDIFSKSNIINRTKKIILKQLTAIYYWQQNLKEIDRWQEPNDILKKIEEFSNKDFLNKIINLNKDYIDSLVIDIESFYKKKDKKALSFDIKSFYKRLEKVLIKEEISELQKKISSSTEESNTEILKKIQKLTEKLKNGNF